MRAKPKQPRRRQLTSAQPSEDMVRLEAMRLALLRAIKVHEDDETQYLVLADALEEQGDLRGELIRVQMALEAPPQSMSSKQRDLLHERQDALLCAHGYRWCPALDTDRHPVTPLTEDGAVLWQWADGKPKIALRFQRGFITRMWCPGWFWWQHGRSFTQCEPVRWVYLSSWPGLMDPAETQSNGRGRYLAWQVPDLLNPGHMIGCAINPVFDTPWLHRVVEEMAAKVWPGMQLKVPGSYYKCIAAPSVFKLLLKQ